MVKNATVSGSRAQKLQTFTTFKLLNFCILWQKNLQILKFYYVTDPFKLCTNVLKCLITAFEMFFISLSFHPALLYISSIEDFRIQGVHTFFLNATAQTPYSNYNTGYLFKEAYNWKIIMFLCQSSFQFVLDEIHV